MFIFLSTTNLLLQICFSGNIMPPEFHEEMDTSNGWQIKIQKEHYTKTTYYLLFYYVLHRSPVCVHHLSRRLDTSPSLIYFPSPRRHQWLFKFVVLVHKLYLLYYNNIILLLLILLLLCLLIVSTYSITFFFQLEGNLPYKIMLHFQKQVSQIKMHLKEEVVFFLVEL